MSGSVEPCDPTLPNTGELVSQDDLWRTVGTPTDSDLLACLLACLTDLRAHASLLRFCLRAVGVHGHSREFEPLTLLEFGNCAYQGRAHGGLAPTLGKFQVLLGDNLKIVCCHCCGIPF